ncbi:hypothetical protein PM10SUCC1_07710 [Propionigenium maris DSM 9537]|uniref:Uncharacterized protein n=1 Tax=Propionigenium maris DSM 9537 TaxID=1123000 RepID=A0A9W6GK18_9FUSO|nr:hypothetical protein PM10SUCC1_07710 [Propionigenium maris DSM 9537]
MFKSFFSNKDSVRQRVILDESYFSLQKAKDEAWRELRSREASSFFASRLSMIQNKILVLIGLGIRNYDLDDFFDHVLALGEFGDEIDEEGVRELIKDYCIIRPSGEK